MFQNIFFMFLLLAIVGCESPLSDKIDGSIGDQSNSESGVDQLYSFSIDGESLKISINWLDGPYSATTKASSLLVTVFKDAELFSLPESLELAFDADMPAMRHGLDKAGFFEELSPGLYLNKRIRFQMDGEWVHELLLIDYEKDEDIEVVKWSSIL